MKIRTPGGEYEVMSMDESAEEYRVIRCCKEYTKEEYRILEFQDEALIKEMLPLFYDLWRSANWEDCCECFVRGGKLCVVLREKEGTSLPELLKAFYEQSGAMNGKGIEDISGNDVRYLYRVSVDSGEPKADKPEADWPERAKSFTPVLWKRLCRLFEKGKNVIQVVVFLILYVSVVLLLLYGFREFREMGEREKSPRYQTIGTLEIQ